MFPERHSREMKEYVAAEIVMFEKHEAALRGIMAEYPEFREREITQNDIFDFLIAKGVSDQWQKEFDAGQELTLDLEALRYQPPIEAV